MSVQALSQQWSACESPAYKNTEQYTGASAHSSCQAAELKPVPEAQIKWHQLGML